MFSSVARTASSRLARVALVVRNQNPLSIQKPSNFSMIPMRNFSATALIDQQEVTDRIMDVIRKFEKVNASQVNLATNFTVDLGLDSLDAVEIVMAIEDEFAVEIPDAEADKIQSVKDAVEYISANPMAK